jgi:DnaK suppressor protein
MNTDIQHYKVLLETELEKINSELESIGTKKESTGTAWSAVQKESQDTADREEVAENLESFDMHANIISILETQKNEVLHALEKVKKGTFGICEITGHEIEKDRLDANPSARTCKACIKR